MRITARVEKYDHGGALPWAVTITYDGVLHVCGARATHAEALAHALSEVGLDRRDTSETTPDGPGIESAGTETEGSCR